MWTCPKCQRPFRNKNQPHSCVQVFPEDLLRGKEASLTGLFQALKDEVTKFGEVQVHASRSAINFTHVSTFLVVKPKTRWLELEFLSELASQTPPVIKVVKAYGGRYAKFARIQQVADLSPELLMQLHESYDSSEPF